MSDAGAVCVLISVSGALDLKIRFLYNDCSTQQLSFARALRLLVRRYGSMPAIPTSLTTTSAHSHSHSLTSVSHSFPLLPLSIILSPRTLTLTRRPHRITISAPITSGIPIRNANDAIVIRLSLSSASGSFSMKLVSHLPMDPTLSSTGLYASAMPDK